MFHVLLQLVVLTWPLHTAHQRSTRYKRIISKHFVLIMRDGVVCAENNQTTTIWIFWYFNQILTNRSPSLLLNLDYEKSITSMSKNGMDVQELWNNFKHTLLEAVDRFTPSKQSRKSHNLLWIDWFTRKLLGRRKRLHTRAKRHQNWNYRNLSREWRQQFRKAEWAYVNNSKPVVTVRGNTVGRHR